MIEGRTVRGRAVGPMAHAVSERGAGRPRGRKSDSRLSTSGPSRTGKGVTHAVVFGLCLLGANTAHAQQTIRDVVPLAFDRPESWAMKYFTELSLPTSMGPPERLGGGTVEVGLEGAFVPQLSDDERRVGFNGTKLEDVNRTRLLGRFRATVGLTASTSLELAYVPPVTVSGATPHILGVAIGRPFALSPDWQLGLRLFGQLGTMKGDITCGANEAAAGPDLVRNPYLCEAPSTDELKQKLVGVEVSAGYGRGRWRPYIGVSVSYLDLQFQVNALYAGLIDHTLQTTNGETVSLTGGLGVTPFAHWRLAGELFYSPLSVVRPPKVSSQNDGLRNGRVLVSYRF
jgi:hypothetical protein